MLGFLPARADIQNALARLDFAFAGMKAKSGHNGLGLSTNDIGINRVGAGMGRLGVFYIYGLESRIVALNYGRHADDQWSVDKLLLLAREHAVVLLKLTRDDQEETYL